MWLERWLVKTLWSDIRKESRFQTQQMFLSSVASQTWPLPYRCFDNKQEFTNRMIFAIKDSIKYGYLEYDVNHPDKEFLVVTASGRSFIALPFGFFEEFQKRRKRTSQFLFGGAFVVLLEGLLWGGLSLWHFVSS
jgi:hypothetical protein